MIRNKKTNERTYVLSLSFLQKVWILDVAIERRPRTSLQSNAWIGLEREELMTKSSGQRLLAILIGNIFA